MTSIANIAKQLNRNQATVYRWGTVSLGLPKGRKKQNGKSCAQTLKYVSDYWDGLTNAQIARNLGLSSSYVSHLGKKLNLPAKGTSYRSAAKQIADYNLRKHNQEKKNNFSEAE